MSLLMVLCLVLAVAGVIENRLHLGRIRRIPIRIHVNGTRGKSTTTRLIAAGLREAGLKVIAKTTGTAARLILEDGSEQPISRRGLRADIIEQVRTAALARRRGADALVVECMAIHPENQWVSEHRMVRATIGVLTNARDDHLDVMGPTIHDAAAALALTVPAHAHLVTTRGEGLTAIMRRAAAIGTTVHVVDGSSVPDDVNEGFAYVSFKDNVACALKACQLAGVDSKVAIRGMLRAAGDPGVTQVIHCVVHGARCVLVNAFAANDPSSTAMLWARFSESLHGRRMPVIAVMNNRSDRPQRIVGLADVVARDLKPDHVVLIGQLGRLARRELARAGLDPARVVDLTGGAHDLRSVLDRLEALVSGETVIFALGNTKGMGQALVNHFADQPGRIEGAVS
ncbi:MAG: poly-gamma-glutamate synthase PgsB [Bacillota bacterium]